MRSGRVVAVIPAKAHSSRLPGKNLRLFAGKPLLVHSIVQAREAARVSEVYVSTDSEEIAATARAAGAKVPFLRSPDLAQAEVHATQPILDMLERTAAGENFEYAMMLLPTSPLRTAEQIDAIASLSIARKTNVLSVVALGCGPFHLRYLGENEALVPVLKDVPRNFQHGDADDVYALNGACYCAPIDEFMRHRSYHYGNPLGYVMDQVTGIDIDTPHQFALAEHLYYFQQAPRGGAANS